MANIQLSLAVGPYDQVRDLLDGTVSPEGIDIIALRLSPEEIFYRFTRFREWDVSEMSFGKYISLVSQGDDSLIAIPVFPSRAFRHSAIYLRADAGIADPAQLAGKRIGVPEWAQTATIYVRGLLTHEYGIDLASVAWWQTGVNEPGRMEKVQLALPKGLRLEAVADRSLSDMLLAGELDAAISARPPAPFTAGDRRIRRLFPDYRTVEQAYWAKTGIFPIMHVIVLRREVYARHRWIAMNLMQAFDAAKNRSVARALDVTASHYPLPWVADYAAQSRERLGVDIWPYGIEANRATLEAFAQYAFEQGVCHRKVQLEELFAPEVQSRFKV
ncbi:MAG TPA: 4,5-dihydroxyphthalate decarboxylase [Alphaproteobacteria bacterium]|nr:4,5-dihydroxyphthalate decarboxylase [Alphaproteobacteria bacterium]